MSSKHKEPVELSEDEERACYLMCLLLVTVSPTLDEQATYDILIDLMMKGLNEDSALTYGHLIREASNPTTSTTKH